MNPRIEIESTRSLAGALGDPFWGWEIPVYLFLGGLVAGLLVVTSIVVLTRGRDRVTPAMRAGLLAAPVLLSLGMGALFLDLTSRAHVYRFYLTLRPTAPMSFGAWILLLVYPVQVLLAFAFPHASLEPWLSRRRWLRHVVELSRRRLALVAWVGLASGIALGVYTGVLLSATVARPLWSFSGLGLLFLASGASAALALLLVLERDAAAQRSLARWDIAVLAAELALVGLWIVGLLGLGPVHRAAAGALVSGAAAPAFLGIVIFGGIVVPLALEVLWLRGRALHSRAVPALVLAGSLALRILVVYAGQDLGFPRA